MIEPHLMLGEDFRLVLIVAVDFAQSLIAYPSQLKYQLNTRQKRIEYTNHTNLNNECN